MADEVEQAVDLFRTGCACSQAVCVPYATRLGLDRTVALRLASGFAGGMRSGEVCGAVTGAIMALSLAHCPDDCLTADRRQAVYAAVTSLIGDFRARHGGALTCRDLMGCDTTTPEGQARAKQLQLWTTLCPGLVRDAAELVGRLLPGSDSPRS
jgi:C_GCAxxG_C_C family probable redox protein